jgi:muconolactone D-isomerase
MQEFLVRIQVHVDPGLDDDTRQALTIAERVRGAELVRAGAIQSIWRVPGTAGNVGVWRAEDATSLHALLSSLPQFRYMDIDVTPLAEHPLAPVLAELAT